MAASVARLEVQLPKELVDELDELALGDRAEQDYYARQAIIEFMEDRADYLRAVATLEKREPRLSLAEAKRALGLDD